MKHLIAILFSLAAALPAAAETSTADVLNAYRASSGTAPVRYSRTLEKMARAHLNDMTRHGFLGHTGSNGAGLADRGRAHGYAFCYMSENLAQGQTSLNEVMQDWAESKYHRKNMMNRKATEFALVHGPGDFWVMVLGRPGC